MIVAYFTITFVTDFEPQTFQNFHSKAIVLPQNQKPDVITSDMHIQIYPRNQLDISINDLIKCDVIQL
jgi:hypothetical protein